MKIFVTGGTGVVGRPTVAGFLARGHEVRAAARSERAATSLRAAGAEPGAVALFEQRKSLQPRNDAIDFIVVEAFPEAILELDTQPLVHPVELL